MRVAAVPTNNDKDAKIILISTWQESFAHIPLPNGVEALLNMLEFTDR
jgi:hypothetical protein